MPGRPGDMIRCLEAFGSEWEIIAGTSTWWKEGRREGKCSADGCAFLFEKHSRIGMISLSVSV